ncbi:RHS repeat-associated core domain protein containing protein [Pseudomonas sp. GM50]|uniref:RHS repeat-associated core domain-containing protein n=1 Tax=Pseudomonas sp. GM50 TaxID=1144332 RepID=UPI000270BFE5|nr:RHS repeat-associated core domain-containing protein [Pseudomonas sp. GM50]EJM64518.1 RHS repeat-associated core domain protein containing protein [Pseudomonas sp. GM50]
MTHANTPAIEAFDSRGQGVRAIAYHRRDGVTAPESCITQQMHDIAGRAVLSRDPRLFLLHQGARQTAANQINIFSLSGVVLLSENSDAGWRLGLFGEDGQGVDGWDQKLSHSRVDYDRQRRPIATFERAHGGPEHCVARFSYMDASADETHNQRGQLIRHDDSAGTQHFVEFSLAGTPLQISRTFVADPQWPIDWPAAEAERDTFLETESAITRIRCNAAGDPVSQTDARGNTQTFLQDRAAQMREVSLKLTGLAKQKTLISEIQYNAFGQIEHQRAGNGVISSATFRPEDGRLEHLKACLPGQPALQDLTYDYDAVGNVTCLTDAAEAAHYHRNQRIDPTLRYRYDSLYRLIEARGRQVRYAPAGPQLPDFQSAPDPGQLENYTRFYTYDNAGNMRVMQHQADSASRTEYTAIAGLSNRSLPQKANGELPEENEIAAGFDLNGNRKYLQPRQDLLWDLRNQLRQVEQVVRENEPDDIEFYLYDGSGQRQRKIRQAYTGTLTRTHETRYLPGVEIRTSPDGILHVITVKAGRGTVQILHWEKEPPSGIPQDQHRYSFTDHLNSSTVELDGAARIITWESYYPYGGTCWWAGRDKQEASYKTVRYSGQERDATGLYYYGQRYYMPWQQRWLSADPGGTADGFNLYAMVRGNPIGYIDNQGLNRTTAVATNTAVDGMASFFGTVTRMIVSVSLSQLPPTETSNNLLLATAIALESSSAAYTTAGLAANSRYRKALPLLAGVTAATLAAVPAFYNRTDLEEGQLNTDAIDRIATVAGNFVRESIQVAGNQQGANYPWGDTALLSRLGAVGPTALVYGGIRAASSYLQAGLHSSISGLFAFLAEAADGGIGTLFRSLHPNTSYQEGSGQIRFDRNYAHNVLHGSIGRNVSATINRELTRLLRPLISTLPSEIQSAILGASGFWTEGRGVVMAAVKRGYDGIPESRVTGPVLGDSRSEHPPSRRSSINNAHQV